MWRFSTTDERRYDHLSGLAPEDTRAEYRSAKAPRKRYLLSVASRYCNWRDGRDPRRLVLSKLEAERVEKAMVRDLVPVSHASGRF